MLPILLLAFIVTPIVELAVILRVGQWLGTWPTVALLVVDSLLGAVLVKREGRRAWHAFRRALEELRWPGDEVAQGALVLVGGALLLTPGFVTDALGLLLVAPPSRSLASRLLRRRMAGRVTGHVIGSGSDRPGRGSSRQDRGPRDPSVEVVAIDRDGPEGPPVDDSK